MEEAWLSIGQSFPVKEQQEEKEKYIGREEDITTLAVYHHSKHKKKKKKKHHSYRKNSISEESSPCSYSSHDETRKTSYKHHQKKSKYERSNNYRKDEYDPCEDDEKKNKKSKKTSKHKKEKSDSRKRKRIEDSSSTNLLEIGKPLVPMLPEDQKYEDHDHLFTLDKEGDRENLFYGTLYTKDTPKYQLYTRRIINTNKWVSSQLPAYSSQEEKDRYFSEESTKFERKARKNRLCLAYSEKRERRKYEEKHVSSTTGLNYIPLDPILEDDQEVYKEDEDREYTTSLVEKTELQSKEQYIVFKTKEFNEKLSKNPHQVSIWLDFMAFQQEAANLLVPCSSGGDGNLLLSLILQVTSSSSKNIKKKYQVALDQAFEKQKAILQKAAHQNPTSGLLKQISLQFTLFEQIQRQQQQEEIQHGLSSTSGSNDVYEVIRMQLENLLDQMASSSSSSSQSIGYEDPAAAANLWCQLVNWQEQNKFSSFTIQTSRDLYARILYIYRKQIERCWMALKTKTAGTNQEDKGLVNLEFSDILVSDKNVQRIMKQIHALGREMVCFHYQMCQLEIKSGFVERAIAQGQALCDVNLFNEGKALDLTRPGWEQTFETWYEQADSTSFVMADLEQGMYIDSNNSFEDHVERSLMGKYMEEIQPSNKIFTKEHQDKLLNQALGQYASGTKAMEADSIVEESNNQQEKGTGSSGGKNKVYSNLHGYRIEVDDVDESAEYERILAELRGQPASIERQEVKQKKQLRQDQHKQKLLERFHDQRVDFNHTKNEKEESKALSWYRDEAKYHINQWIPLRSNHPAHAALIEDAPDRAIMAEEMIPFLFQVPSTFHLQLVWNLLRTLGIKISLSSLHLDQLCMKEEEEEEEDGETMRKAESMDSFYLDTFEEMESALVAPILDILGSKLVTKKEEGQLSWSVQETIHQLETKVLMNQMEIAVDPVILFMDTKRITMIRQIFQQAVKYFNSLPTTSNRKQLEIALLQIILIEFETLYILFLREKGGNTIASEQVEALRRKCQGFLETFQQDFANQESLLLWFAYARMEWRLSNLTQVRRLCDTLLVSLRSQDYERQSALLERMIFFRLRCDLWQGTHPGIPRGVQVALYVLLNTVHPSMNNYSPLPNESKKPKQYKKLLEATWAQCAEKPSMLQDLCVIYEQRIDQILNTSDCIQKDVVTSSNSGGNDSFICKCGCGFLIHNYCVHLYVMEHFQLSIWNFQQHVSQVFERLMDRLHRANASRHLEWLSFCYLEYLQQYQLTTQRLTRYHWRNAVYKCIQQQHSSPSVLLLRLFLNAEMSSSTAITSRNLRLFFEKDIIKSSQRVYMWPTTIQWIFALLCEFTHADKIARSTRPSILQDESENGYTKQLEEEWCCLLHRWNGSTVLVDRIREVFEASVSLSSNRDTLTSQGLMMSLQHRISTICWRLYLRFEVAMGKIDLAKRILYRGLTKCPWSLHLFHDAFQVLGKYLNEQERQEIIQLLQAKELHTRLEP